MSECNFIFSIKIVFSLYFGRWFLKHCGWCTIMALGFSLMCCYSLASLQCDQVRVDQEQCLVYICKLKGYFLRRCSTLVCFNVMGNLLKTSLKESISHTAFCLTSHSEHINIIHYRHVCPCLLMQTKRKHIQVLSMYVNTLFYI